MTLDQQYVEDAIANHRKNYLLQIKCSKDPIATEKIKKIMAPFRSFKGSTNRYTFSWTLLQITWNELLSLNAQLEDAADGNIITLRVNPV